MRDDPGGRALFFVLILGFVALSLLPFPVLSAKTIYTYVDDAGTTHYTNRLASVPNRYRSRVQEMDAVTPEADPTATTTIADNLTLPPVYQEEPSAGLWFEGLPSVAMPVPSRFQLGVGLSSLVLIIGAVVAHGVSRNPMVRFMLKVAVTLLLVGTFYAMYFSGLNERIAELTRGGAHEPMTGRELMGEDERQP